VNCHRGPDLDSVGSALAMREALIRMGKKVAVVCPSPIPNEYFFLKGAERIQTVDFTTFPFETFDLFVVLDTQNLVQFTGSLEIPQPDIPTVIIDHHAENTLDANVTLVREKTSSCSELLYRWLLDCKVAVTKTMATSLLAGIFRDTVMFSVPGYGHETFAAAEQLMKLGADKDGIIQRVIRRYDLDQARLAGHILSITKRDPLLPIMWSVVDARTFARFGKPRNSKEITADLFFSSIDGVELGIIFFEEQKRVVQMSFRSRGRFDCSALGRKFGGGGHRSSAGGIVKGDLQTVVREALREARRMIQRMKSPICKNQKLK